MLKNLFKGFGFLVIFMFFYGCASKGIEVRSYIQDKPRVDQAMEGNAGFLDGTPQPESPVKPTRQVIVVEVTKEAREDMADHPAPASKKVEDMNWPAAGSSPAMMEQAPASETQEDNTETSMEDDAGRPVAAPSPKIQQESKQLNPEPSSEASGYREYKVEKDDTLQKISKKFYDNYSKWIKIYEANKDVIKNPDRIKPGITIKIPNL